MDDEVGDARSGQMEDGQAERLGASARALGARLLELGERIASCESCTSGAVADAITSPAGASAWFEAGLVCYSERAKTEFAGVGAELFESAGVVSVEVALAMARGVASRAGCRFGVATTGLAGPGGSVDPRGAALPQGLVCFAVVDALDGREDAESRVFEGGRARVRRQATAHAMAMASALALRSDPRR